MAHKLQNYGDALQFFAEAFRKAADAKHRGRLLNDIAFSLKELGHINDARKTWLASYLIAKGDSRAKWAAGVNLHAGAHATG